MDLEEARKEPDYCWSVMLEPMPGDFDLSVACRLTLDQAEFVCLAHNRAMRRLRKLNFRMFEQARAVKALMRKHPGTGITLSDIVRYKICANREGAQRVLDELACDGIAEVFERGMTPKGGRLTKAFRLVRRRSV